MIMFPKKKRERKKGNATSKLTDLIHERDRHQCICCGRSVDPGEKWHHWPFGKEKEDIPEKGVLLCFECHQKAHKSRVLFYAVVCGEYLSELYPHMTEYYRRFMGERKKPPG